MMTADQKAAWLSERAGKLTASRMAAAMSFLKNGAPSAERVKLLHELLAERLTGFSVPHVVTEAMEWGLMHEDEAVDFFAARYTRQPRPSRFYEHPALQNFGATPDREIDDGLMEIKCPTTAKFIAWKLGGAVPEEHKPQMCAQLLCTGKSWCGFVAYDPRLPEDKRLFMRKYEPTQEELSNVFGHASAFLDELDAMFDKFVSA
jgi:putative phage-type endonuclease